MGISIIGGGVASSGLPAGATELIAEVDTKGFTRFTNSGLGLAAGKYLIEAVETNQNKTDCMFQVRSQKAYINNSNEADSLMRITLPVAEDYLDINAFRKFDLKNSGLGWNYSYEQVNHADSSTYSRLSDSGTHLSVARGNNVKVMLTRYAPYRIFRDTNDGNGWTSAYTAVNAQHSYNQVVYGADKFVLITGNGQHDAGINLQTSTDGVTWTNYGSTNAGPAFNYANGVFVSLRSTAVWASTDGINWTQVLTHSLSMQTVVKPQFANGVWLIWGSSGVTGNYTYYTSTDGYNWTTRYWVKAQNYGTSYIPYHVRSANGIFLASVSANGSTRPIGAGSSYEQHVLYSTDGVDWKKLNIGGSAQYTYSGYAFGQTYWWTGWGPSCLSYWGGYYVARGNPPSNGTSTNTSCVSLISKDLVNWTPWNNAGRYASESTISNPMHDYWIQDDYDGGMWHAPLPPVATKFRIYKAAD